MSATTEKAARQDDAVRSWVQELMRAKRTDPTGLARLAEINQSILSRFMNGRTAALGPSTLHALARLGTVPPPEPVRLLLERAAPRPVRREMRAPSPVSLPEYEGSGLPVWGVHPLERDGEFHLNPVAMQVLRRPANLAGPARMACFYAPDETMAPRWQMGEPVVVDLIRPATQGAVALVKLANGRDPNGDDTYLLRRYDGRSAGHMLLSRLADAPGTLRIQLPRVLALHRVLAWGDFLA